MRRATISSSWSSDGRRAKKPQNQRRPQRMSPPPPLPLPPPPPPYPHPPPAPPPPYRLVTHHNVFRMQQHSGFRSCLSDYLVTVFPIRHTGSEWRGLMSRVARRRCRSARRRRRALRAPQRWPEECSTTRTCRRCSLRAECNVTRAPLPPSRAYSPLPILQNAKTIPSSLMISSFADSLASIWFVVYFSALIFEYYRWLAIFILVQIYFLSNILNVDGFCF